MPCEIESWRMSFQIKMLGGQSPGRKLSFYSKNEIHCFLTHMRDLGARPGANDSYGRGGIFYKKNQNLKIPLNPTILLFSIISGYCRLFTVISSYFRLFSGHFRLFPAIFRLFPVIFRLFPTISPKLWNGKLNFCPGYWPPKPWVPEKRC